LPLLPRSTKGPSWQEVQFRKMAGCKFSHSRNNTGDPEGTRDKNGYLKDNYMVFWRANMISLSFDVITACLVVSQAR